MEQKFKIKENGFSEISKFLIIKMVSLLAIGLFIAVLIKSEGFTTGLDTFLVVMAIFVPVFTIIIFFAVKRGKKQFESFTLTINEHEIFKKQLYINDVVIPIQEIRSIDKNEKGGVTIQGNTPDKVIFVPTQIEGFTQLEKMLLEI